MRILVIPDVHLKPWMFDKADEVDKNKYDKIVCLGDIADDWGQQLNQDLYEKTFERVLQFDKDHPDMFWCLGNHDYSYLWGFPETGFSTLVISLVANYILKLEKQAGKRLGIVHDVDGILFSHAGLTDYFVQHYFHNSIKDDPKDTRKQVLKAINYAWKDKSHAEKLWQNESPIWFRPPHYSMEHTFLFGQTENDFKQGFITQVAGHTPDRTPYNYHGLLMLDTFSTYRCGDAIGDQKFVIVNTEKQNWEYA